MKSRENQAGKRANFCDFELEFERKLSENSKALRSLT
jgi:hypothetical protein